MRNYVSFFVRVLPSVALRIFFRENAVYTVAWNMENPMMKIRRASTFSDCFTRVVTSRDSGMVGDRIGNIEMERKSLFSVKGRQARPGTSCIENWKLQYPRAGWRKSNLTAVRVKTTQVFADHEINGASSVTLPFQQLMLCWAVV
jgi:hypothetical protein